MKILIRGTTWIGDAVMTIPAINKLRRLFPDAHLTLQTRPATAGLFRDSGLVDAIISPVSFSDQIRVLRQGRYDLAIIFPNSFRSALATRLGDAKRVFGYAAQHRSFLMTDGVPVPNWKETSHEVYYYLELVNHVEQSYFGSVTESNDLEPRISLPSEKLSSGRAILDALGVDRNSVTVAIAPGSTNSEAKRWHPESFAHLGNRLYEELGANVVLMGSKDERDISHRVAELSSSRLFDLTGATSISDAAAVLSEVDLLVSNDMGLAHVAPAVGTETLVIFGPTNPITTRPLSRHAHVITAAVECAPCMLRTCPIDHRCMTRVSVDMVLEKAKRLLAR